jgi:uncharacterized lipoprotein YmbA
MTLTRHAPRRGAALVALAASTLLGGCGSAPEVRFHSLLPAEPPAASAASGARVRLVVAGVRLPPAIDQPQWLVRRADDTLQSLEQDRWAGPLGDEFRAALREGLAARWGVEDGALPTAPGAAAPPAWRLVLEVLRLDAWPGRESLIEARWTLVPPSAGGAAAGCLARITEPARGEGSVPLADAHRRAVARLTDDIGRGLQALARGGRPDCNAGR